MNLIKWIKRKSILKKRIIFFEKKLKNAMDINNLNFHEGEIYGALHLAYDLGIIDYEGYSGVTNEVSALLLIVVYTTRFRSPNTIYFTSGEKAEGAIEVFKDELKWYYTKYQQRLDEE